MSLHLSVNSSKLMHIRCNMCINHLTPIVLYHMYVYNIDAKLLVFIELNNRSLYERACAALWYGQEVACKNNGWRSRKFKRIRCECIWIIIVSINGCHDPWKFWKALELEEKKFQLLEIPLIWSESWSWKGKNISFLTFKK